MEIRILKTAEKELEKIPNPLNKRFGKHIEKLASKEIKEKDFELIEVLESLGFKREKIFPILKKINPDLKFEEKIKEAIKMLSSCS